MMATGSAAHLRDIAAPLSPTHSSARRSARLPELATGSLPSVAGSNPQTGNPTLPAVASLPQEDRDAALTGSTRSLARRLFALNLHAQAAQPIPAMPHRPGSVLLRSA